MLPWSVMAHAGMPNLATRFANSSGRLAPSRREYSVWRWRCANDIRVGAHSTRRERRSPPGTVHSLLLPKSFKEDFAYDENDEVARSCVSRTSHHRVWQHLQRKHVVRVIDERNGGDESQRSGRRRHSDDGESGRDRCRPARVDEGGITGRSRFREHDGARSQRRAVRRPRHVRPLAPGPEHNQYDRCGAPGPERTHAPLAGSIRRFVVRPRVHAVAGRHAPVAAESDRFEPDAGLPRRSPHAAGQSARRRGRAPRPRADDSQFAVVLTRTAMPTAASPFAFSATQAITAGAEDRSSGYALVTI